MQRTLVRVDRYTRYIQYIGICLDTGIGDIDNSKIPIYRHFGTLLRNTGLKSYFESNLLTIVFRNQSYYTHRWTILFLYSTSSFGF